MCKTRYRTVHRTGSADGRDPPGRPSGTTTDAPGGTTTVVATTARLVTGGDGAAEDDSAKVKAVGADTSRYKSASASRQLDDRRRRCRLGGLRWLGTSDGVGAALDDELDKHRARLPKDWYKQWRTNSKPCAASETTGPMRDLGATRAADNGGGAGMVAGQACCWIQGSVSASCAVMRA